MKAAGGEFHVSSFYLTLGATLHLFISGCGTSSCNVVFSLKKMLLKEKQGHAGWDWACSGGWEKVESDPSAEA